MVGSIIQKDDCVLSPIWSFLVKLQAEVTKEDTHGLVIGVALYQADVDPALRVESRNHGDPRVHQDHRHRIGRAFGSPLHFFEVCLAKPGFINI